MKILALEQTVSGAVTGETVPHLRAEAERVWELYQAGVIREISFRQDRPEAVIVLECDSPGEAEKIIASLPLVQLGLIRFEIIPLVPYPGFARLFK
jgi:hypothetical protein